MSATTPFLGLAGHARAERERNIIRPDAEDNSQADQMPPRRTTHETAQYEESIESLMRMFLTSQTAFMDAQAARVQAQAHPNGEKWDRRVQTGVLCGTLLFSAVWWTRGTQGSVEQTLALHEYKQQQQAQQIQTLTDRVQSSEYIFAKLQQNLAASFGIQIDPQTGEVRRIRKER